MSRRRIRLVCSVPFLVGLLGLLSSVAGLAANGRTVYVLPTTGIVDNVMAGYLRDGIARASRDGAPAVIIRLNTPGGSLEATNEIVGTLLQADVPTIVWVAPAGGRAASAGTFITLAANVAVMAPGTTIGAATPVGGQGEDIPGALGDKVRNDAIEKMRSIADERGRNVDWAISTVEKAVSSAANDAVSVGGVDGIARSIEEVVAFANGRMVTVSGQALTLDLAGVATEELGMNPLQGFLHLLSDPNIAFILFTLGFYGLLYEVISPNFVTGIVGALAIILAFIGFGSLPLNVAGLLLIGLAIVLFLLELTVTSHGLLTVAGLVCLALGASALYTEPGTPVAPDVAVAVPLIVTMLITTALFMALALWTIVRTRRRIPALAAIGYGAGGTTRVPPGTPGEVRRPLTPIGVVYAAGEEWSARASAAVQLDRGARVVVVGQEGLTLIVEPVTPSGAPA